MTDVTTVQYYRSHAVEYAAATAGVSMGHPLRSFGEMLDAGASVLDIGCGGGRDLRELRLGGFNPVGLEQSPELAQIAARHSGCPVAVADMMDMPFADGSFDAVWSSASLVHFGTETVPRALRQVRRVLRTDGVFFASVKRGDGAGTDASGRYFTYFQPAQWIAIVEAAGFEMLAVLDEEPPTSGTPRWIRILAKSP
ncbi:class I SAM-dependent methyltransferase (plasmid) [Devosia neptuniae]|uniref:Class I SAM-dependent methyltransferase n=1 Tax=Devosia neptuniae TaxID=191302 RepID=A0ABY6C6Q4_9HYPH|nr:class I SAM-dependent methyltransferase [Devosia neptuniae]UXN67938.1 class I SAM-dependent methyltransferase [Devosia neptuniae]